MRNPIRTKAWLITITILAVCFPALAQAAIHIELGVAQGALYVISNDGRCPDGRIDCIQPKRGDEPDLFFDLDKACKNDGPQFKLTQFRIGMKEKQWPTAENPLPDYVAKDFHADPNTGIVDLAAGQNQLKDDRIKLKDSNSSAYTVYYEVQALPCSGGNAIVLDPAVRNTGK
jgi:hypothetical protein